MIKNSPKQKQKRKKTKEKLFGRRGKPSAGAEALIDAVNLVLVTSGEVVSEGDPAQFPGFKTTGDKASLQNAPKAQKGCTSLQLQHLCNGVRNGDWSNSVKYMVTQPQSCLRAFVLRLWFGNDDAANMEAHGAPVMEEGVKLEDGVDLDLPMQRVCHGATCAHLS